jgi:putative ABC transport system substrate-binding protein
VVSLPRLPQAAQAERPSSAHGDVELNDRVSGTQERDPNRAIDRAAWYISAVNREPIVALAAQYRLPAVYPYKYFITAGGLVSYGVDTVDLYRRAAGYVDRILKGP